MSGKKKLIRSAVIGSLCGMLTGVILMCIAAAFMMTAGLLPPDALNWALTAVTAVSCAAGGFVAARLNKGAGLVVGAITGAAIMLFVTAAAIIRGDADISVLLPIKAAASVTGGIAGGILGLRERNKIKL